MKQSVCWNSLSITYLLSLKGIFFNKSSASLWEQTVHISLPMIAYALYHYEAVFMQRPIKGNINTETKEFNLTFRNIDDFLSAKNPHFSNWIPKNFRERK
jgi:hypothetical protein